MGELRKSLYFDSDDDEQVLVHEYLSKIKGRQTDLIVAFIKKMLAQNGLTLEDIKWMDRAEAVLLAKKYSKSNTPPTIQESVVNTQLLSQLSALIGVSVQPTSQNQMRPIEGEKSNRITKEQKSSSKNTATAKPESNKTSSEDKWSWNADDAGASGKNKTISKESSSNALSEKEKALLDELSGF